MTMNRPVLRTIAAVALALISGAVGAVGPERGTQSEAGQPPADLLWFHPDGHESGLIEIKFREGLQIRLRDGQPVDLDGTGLRSGAAQGLLDRYAAGRWERSHAQVSEEFLAELQATGQARSGRALADLNLWFRLHLPAGIAAPEAWLDWTELAEVESVWYVDRPTPNPQAAIPNYRSFNPAASEQPWQRYLDPAPDGIDLGFVQQNYVLVLTGFGTRICDIEYIINPDHDDLGPVTVLGPMQDPGGFGDDHATAVMGQIGARRNTWGIEGIAPGTEMYFASSAATGTVNIASAITTALTALDAGDVILLEAQSVGPMWTSGQLGLVPVEWVKATFDAIETATAAGVIVVQAGANGSQNLDAAIYSTGNNGHYPFLVQNGVRVTDSGAIIVGGGNSPLQPVPRSANNSTNFGQRLDVQGYGNNVVTLGYGFLYPGVTTVGEFPDIDILPPDQALKNQFLTAAFGGTSAASPIVAGAALLIQEYARRLRGTSNPLTPVEMRQLLIDTGTPQSGAAQIGPLPDLRAANTELAAQNPLPAISFNPAPGTYSSNPFDVRINPPPGTSFPDVIVRYTTDSTPVTRDSPLLLSSSFIRLRNPTTIRARAFSLDFTVSPEIVGFFSIPPGTPTVANVTLLPENPNFSTSTFVGLSTGTPDASIYVTTDGTDPSPENGSLVTGGAIGPITATTLVRARAFKANHPPSAISERLYSLIPPPPSNTGGPILVPSPGTFYQPVNLQLLPPNGSDIVRFTLDGTEPDQNSPVFEPANDGLLLAETTLVRARAFRAGASPSAVVGGVYTISGTVAAPTIAVAGSPPHVGAATVTLSTISPGASIRYTINGDIPQSFSPLYTGPITLGVGGNVVRARAFAGALTSQTSAQIVEVFSVDGAQAVQPVATPFTSGLVEPAVISLSTSTQGATIRYEVSTGLPIPVTAASPIYTGPFILLNSEGGAMTSTFYQVTARAFKPGLSSSAQMQKSYQVATPLGTISAPTIGTSAQPNSATGKFDNPITVNLSSTTSPPTTGIRYYRTLDGSDPVVPDPPGTGPATFTLSANATVKAIAWRDFFGPSPVSLASLFQFQVAPPVISPAESDHFGSVQVSLTTATSGGGTNLRYTLDGSEPTPSSTLYSGPFTLGIGEYVLRVRGFRNHFDPSPVTSSYFSVGPVPVLPSILSQLSPVTVQQGQDIWLQVSAEGVPAPEYQWFIDGEALGGANESFLLIPGAQSFDAGQYSVQVSNSQGTVTSSAVSVEVLPGPADDVFADRFQTP